MEQSPAPRILVWFWSGGGGGSRYAANLAARLQSRFGGVSLSLRADDPTSAEVSGAQVLRADVVSARAQPFGSLLGMGASWRALHAHMRAASADIVVVAMNFATAAPLALRLGLPLVYVAHDPEPHPGDYAMMLQRVSQAVLLRRAAGVVAPSAFSAARLSTRVGSDRLHVAPLNAVIKPRDAPRPGLAQGEPLRFLLLGRLLAYKGAELLLDALNSIRGRDDWRLTVAGFGAAGEATRARFERLPQVTVRLGWLSEAEFDAMIAGHDILLAPYVSASQSGVIAEALAQGMPVAATPVGALREQMAGVAGWLAKEVSASAFAEVINEALARRQAYAQYSRDALQIARRTYEADHWGWLGAIATRRLG